MVVSKSRPNKQMSFSMAPALTSLAPAISEARLRKSSKCCTTQGRESGSKRAWYRDICSGAGAVVAVAVVPAAGLVAGCAAREAGAGAGQVCSSLRRSAVVFASSSASRIFVKKECWEQATSCMPEPWSCCDMVWMQTGTCNI